MFRDLCREDACGGVVIDGATQCRGKDLKYLDGDVTLTIVQTTKESEFD